MLYHIRKALSLESASHQHLNRCNHHHEHQLPLSLATDFTIYDYLLLLLLPSYIHTCQLVFAIPAVIPRSDPTNTTHQHNDQIKRGTKSLEKLIMTLPEERFFEMTQIFKKTPNLSPAEMRSMLLEAESLRKQDEILESTRAHRAEMSSEVEKDITRGLRAKAVIICRQCGKMGHHEKNCWFLQPEKAPEWLSERLKGEEKKKSKKPKGEKETQTKTGRLEKKTE